MCETLPASVYTVNTLEADRSAALEPTGLICYANILCWVRLYLVFNLCYSLRAGKAELDVLSSRHHCLLNLPDCMSRTPWPFVSDNPKLHLCFIPIYFQYSSKVFITSKLNLTSHILVQVTPESSCKTYTGNSRFRPQTGDGHWTERAHHQGVSGVGGHWGTTSYHSKTWIQLFPLTCIHTECPFPT